MSSNSHDCGGNPLQSKRRGTRYNNSPKHNNDQPLLSFGFLKCDEMLRWPDRMSTLNQPEWDSEPSDSTLIKRGLQRLRMAVAEYLT